MRQPFTLSFLSTFLFLIINISSLPSQAQETTMPDSFSKKSSKWNPKKHDVPVGSKVHMLPQGLPLASFSKGGEKEKELEDFLMEQNVAGIIILKDGKIRLERYARGHSESNRWSSMSVAKSVTSTLVGAAIKDGFIKSVDDYVTGYIPDLKGTAYDSVKIRHLLTMTTGIRWNESYTDPDGDISRFSTDPIEPGMNATVSYMRRLPAVAAPGKKWLYSTGETHLLGVLVSMATHQSLSHYLSSKIWIPYGMQQQAAWALDRTGQEMAGCCLEMTLRDFARFGQFVLEDGHINGESIVPKDWFKKAANIQVPLWPGGGYGFGWWIFNNHSFEALGIYGQMIHIDPSRRLVVAVNSEWPVADSDARHVAVAKFLKSVEKEIDKEGNDFPN